MAANALPPLCLTAGNPVEQWEQWLNRFKIYLVATEVNKKAETIQVAQLLHFAGPELQKIYATFQFTAEEKDKLQPAIDKFNNHFKPQENLNFIRYKFFTSRQGDLPLDQFITDLRKQASLCKFRDLTDDLIMCVLISGTNNSETREKLLQKEELKLDEAVKMCAIIEQAKSQSKNIDRYYNKQSNHDVPVQIDAVSSRYHQSRQQTTGREPPRRQSSRPGEQGGRKRSKSRSRHPPGNRSGNFINNCSRCGSSHPINKCLAYGKVCGNCKKNNHFATMCRVNKNHIKVVNTSEDIDNSLYIGMVTNSTYNRNHASHVSTINSNYWMTALEINNKTLSFKIDTGAQVNIISIKDYVETLKLPIDILYATKVQLKSYTGDKISVLGACKLDCQKNDNKYLIEFYIVNDYCEAIIGLPTSLQLKLIQNIDTTPSCNNLHNDNKIVSTTQNVQNITSLVHEKFGDLFSGIGMIKPPFHISTKLDVQPVITPVRKVPFALLEPLKKALNELEQSKIIEKVNGPSDWVNPLVLVKKSDNSLRICLDPFHLNKAIKREHSKLDTFDEITSRMSNAKIFSKLDASQAFHQIPLDESSSNLCTFGTPYGRFKFKRLPYGITCAPEIFNERFKTIFNFNNVGVYIDDLLIWGSDQKQHDETLCKVLDSARQHGVKFNLSKCQFSVKQIKFMGHIISESGISIDPDRLKAISEIPTPTCKKDVQRLIGVINYVSKYIPNFSIETQALRDLLKKDVLFKWEESQQRAFETIKESLTKRPVLQFFDPRKEIVISVDSSNSGIGTCLLQDNKPVCYSSKALTETQKHYAQIEKELLAVLYGLQKYHEYVFGRHVVVETDHKPLITIVKKPIDKCPPRLQRLRLELLKYHFTLKYKKGTELVIADALSRAYLSDNIAEGEIPLGEQICVILSGPNISDEYLEKIKIETGKDDTLKQLLNTIIKGWPNNNSKLNERIKIFCKYKNDLTVDNGIIYKGEACLIPGSLRKEVLGKIHYSHLGYNKTIKLAEESVFWPTMRNEVKQMIESCPTCQKYRPAQRAESLRSHDIIAIPWLKVGSDIFELNGQSYLLLVDYYSKFVEVEKLSGNTTSTKIINIMKSIFARFGVPQILVTDGGPQYTSENFKAFSEQWGFKHILTSPYNSQSNGMAERQIQTVKQLFKKVAEDNKDIYMALLQWRNTPIFENLSPSELLMSRRTRHPLLPLNIKKLQPHAVKHLQYSNYLSEKQNKTTNYYNKIKGARELKPLPANKKVWVQLRPETEWLHGKVISRLGERRYKISVENKGTYIRNRKFLRESIMSHKSDDHNHLTAGQCQKKRVRWSQNVNNELGDVNNNNDDNTLITLDPINNLLCNSQVTAEASHNLDQGNANEDSNYEITENAEIVTTNLLGNDKHNHDQTSLSTSETIINSEPTTSRGRPIKPPKRLNL